MSEDRKRYTDDMTLVSPAPLKRLLLPGQPLPLQLQARDLAILRIVAAERYCSSSQIARGLQALGFPSSAAKTRLRLRLLWANGYVERPHQQAVYASAFMDEGNRPLIYALTAKGAALLRERGERVDPRLTSNLKNNARTTAPFMAHTLEVAEAMLGFRGSGEAAAKLVDHAELFSLFPVATRALRDPFRLDVTFRHELKLMTLRVRPDRLFSLVTSEPKRHNYALELDRSTEVITPRSKQLAKKSSIRRKLLGYFHAHEQGLHTQLWGFQGFRVLFITPSEIRLRHMIDAQREITGDRLAGMFLYTTKERLALEGGPLAPVWRSAVADHLSLLPKLPAQSMQSR